MSARVAVITSLYNNSDLFVRALWGYAAQRHQQFQIIVADDGSKPEEVEVVAIAARQLGLNVAHLWQEDRGFRKTKILNHAIAYADAEQLIFVDADMIPRSDFVQNHVQLLRPGYFIAGGPHLNLPAAMHSDITPDVVTSGQLFSWEWLSRYPIEARRFRLRLGKVGWRARMMDALFPRFNAFIGCNSSCWRADALLVNGFDAHWGYGSEDRDFGTRLTNAGIKSRRHQFSLLALHQDHDRSYQNPQQVQQNKLKLKARSQTGMFRVADGIEQLDEADCQLLYTALEKD